MSDDRTEISVNIESQIEKEAARVIGKLTDATVDAAIAAGSNILGGLLGDRLREWRTRNLVKHAAKTSRYLNDMGVPIEKARILPMGEIYTIFDYASKQDDDKISDLWAALLANAVNPDGDLYSSSYIETIKSLTPCEARILELMWLMLCDKVILDVPEKYVDIHNNIMQLFGEKQAEIAVAHLVSMKLIYLDGSYHLHGHAGVFGVNMQHTPKDDAKVTMKVFKENISLLIDAMVMNLGSSNRKVPYVDYRVIHEGRLRGSNKDYAQIELFYLTDFGKNLMDACHLPRKAK